VSERLLSVRDVASLLGLHRGTVYGYIRDGKLPYVLLGNRKRFQRTAIDKFIEGRSVSAVDLSGFLIGTKSLDNSLAGFDKRFLKGGTKALSKDSRHWHYAFGSIFLRKTKEGEDRFYLDYRDQGKRIREVVKHAQNRGEALLALQRRTSEIFDGKFHPRREAEQLKFRDLASMYLENYAKVQKKSWKTDSCYLNAHLIPFFGDYLLSSISQLAVEQYISRRISDGVQKSTVNRELACLKKMLNKAIDWGYLDENPVRKVKFFSEKDNLKERVLTPEEETKLLESCPECLRTIVLTAIHTGMRRAEVLNLRWEDVNLEKKEIKVRKTKSGSIRTIPINETLYSMLSRLKKKKGSSGYLFNNPRTGEPFKDVKKAFKGACERAGIEGLRFHDLRHTFATRLVENGADLITVKDLLGHFSVRITERYTHSNKNMKRQAVESLAQARKAEEKTENLAQIGHMENNPARAISLFSVN
jgi:excisionase family DNA binding protein